MGWGFVFGGDSGRRVQDHVRLAGQRARVQVGEVVQKAYGASGSDFPHGRRVSVAQKAFMTKGRMLLQGGDGHSSRIRPELQWAAAPSYPSDKPRARRLDVRDLDILNRSGRSTRGGIRVHTYMQSQAAMEKLCLLQTKHSPLAQASPTFYEQHPNPYIRLFTDMPKNDSVVSPPKIAIWPEYSSELRNAFDQVFVEGMDPQEVLTRVRLRCSPRSKISEGEAAAAEEGDERATDTLRDAVVIGFGVFLAPDLRLRLLQLPEYSVSSRRLGGARQLLDADRDEVGSGNDGNTLLFARCRAPGDGVASLALCQYQGAG